MKTRVLAAFVPVLWHLSVSLILAAASAALVFRVWYPAPYDGWVGGQNLFILLVGVDIVIGPLLTAIVFNPAKPKAELWRDLSVVVILQLSALIYGISSVYQARPVFLAFEGDRFRVVTAPDIDPEHLADAPVALRHLPTTGPQLLGVRLLTSGSSDYLKSVELAVKGLHPAFRPSRWLSYADVKDSVRQQATALTELQKRSPENSTRLNEQVKRLGLTPQDVSFLPVIAMHHTDWVVLINTHTGNPVGFSHVDGW